MTTAVKARRVLTRYADAWTAGDLGALFASYHDDVVFHYFGQNPLAGTHRGKAAAMATLMEATHRTRRSLKAVVSVMAGDGGRGCILARETVMRGDEAVEIERALVYRVAEEAILECWLYDQDQAQIDGMLGGEP